MVTRRQYSYYQYNRLLSYNAIFNFLVGSRGLGKTYGAKKLAVRAAIDRGEEFIYLRRYKSELIARNTFFTDIQHEFPNHSFRMVGDAAQAKVKNDRKKSAWKTIGYFIALSNSQSQKSRPFPNVRNIIFDEFIIERGVLRYLPDEYTIFINFYQTVDRFQDRARVFFLANSVSIMNPYFIELGIEIDNIDNFMRMFNGYVVVEIPDADKFKSEVANSRFGRFIQNTEYAKYAIGNEFSDASDNLIGAKDPRMRYQFTLETQKGTFAFWRINKSDDWYAGMRRPKDEELYTMIPEKVTTDKMLVGFSDVICKLIRHNYRKGNIVFDKPQTRNAMTEVFKR